MQCPKAALFDLDETLAESFMPPKADMTERVARLLGRMPVAIVTGRDFARVEPQFLPVLTRSPGAKRLFVLPESSARCLQWDGSGWREHYSFSLAEGERASIRTAIEESVAQTQVLEGQPCFGERFLEKPAQTAFAMLGLQVPTELKRSWDPDNARRKKLQRAIAEKLPDFEVLLGGATSIDVTKQGVDKSYGVSWLSKYLDIPTSEMLYVGDALEEGGNDVVVIPTGIRTIQTSGPEETLGILDELLKSCGVE